VGRRVVASIRRFACCLGGRQGLQADHRRVQVFALAQACFFAAEFETVDVGLRREAAGPRQQALQRVAWHQLVDAGRGDFTFDRYQAGLARDRDTDVLLAVDGDDVTRQQLDDLRRVVLKQRTSEVERDDLRRQV